MNEKCIRKWIHHFLSWKERNLWKHLLWENHLKGEELQTAYELLVGEEAASLPASSWEQSIMRADKTERELFERVLIMKSRWQLEMWRWSKPESIVTPDSAGWHFIGKVHLVLLMYLQCKVPFITSVLGKMVKMLFFIVLKLKLWKPAISYKLIRYVP